ncbi:ribulose-phosphate 3-epimerase, partial [Candidatus Woesearchaeota archaeon CG10_big_fil_rev_8_21_14_0_10_32_9]
IDGGVNETTAKKLVKSGANILTTGSFVITSKDPKKAIKILQNA